jgi:hypothetical protein
MDKAFPRSIPLIAKKKRFKKYQWIEVALKKASDPRPESYHINIDTIKLGRLVPPNRGWSTRRAILKPLIRPSLCAIQKERDLKGHPTLGIFKPAKIGRLLIVADSADWTPKQKSILGQKTFGFASAPRAELEKIPFQFSYEFTCNEDGCKGHRLLCTDWEMAEAYRTWRKSYGDQWEEKFHAKFERDMIEKFDTHFYVGTLSQHPKNWIIVGLFYPPKSANQDLFQ